MSPRAWKASFSEFHRSYSPGQRHSFRSPDKPWRSSLSRESSTLAVSTRSSTVANPLSESREMDVALCHSENPSSAAKEDAAAGASGEELKSGEDSSPAEKEKGSKESDNKGDDEKAPPSESSSELNDSFESRSLELSAVDNDPLHIEEEDDDPVNPDTAKANGLENGGVSGFNSDTKDQNIPHKVSGLINTQLRHAAACFYYICQCYVSELIFFLFHLGCPRRESSIQGLKKHRCLKISHFHSRFVCFSCAHTPRRVSVSLPFLCQLFLCVTPFFFFYKSQNAGTEEQRQD